MMAFHPVSEALKLKTIKFPQNSIPKTIFLTSACHYSQHVSLCVMTAFQSDVFIGDYCVILKLHNLNIECYGSLYGLFFIGRMYV